VRIENELYGRALVKIGITFGRFLERDHLRIDDVRDWDAIVQDGLHELTIVAQDRRLAGKEGMRFRPAETEIERQRALRSLFVMGPGIFGHVESRNANRARVTGDFHGLVEHDRRLFGAAMTFRLETNRVDKAVNDRLTNYRGDKLAQPVVCGEINRLETNLLRD
jgi:hypothetical protein